MPCYEPRFAEVAGKTIMKDDAVAYTHKLVRLLCEAMHIVEGSEDTAGPAIEQASPELMEWWKEHKEWDRRRSGK